MSSANVDMLFEGVELNELRQKLDEPILGFKLIPDTKLKITAMARPPKNQPIRVPHVEPQKLPTEPEQPEP